MLARWLSLAVVGCWFVDVRGVVDLVGSFDVFDAFLDGVSHGKHILSVQVLFFVSFNRYCCV